MSEPAFSLRLAKSAARWADKNLPETGETVWEALGLAFPDETFPCPEALMFLRDWLVSNPLKVFRMTPQGLADELGNVARTAEQFQGRRFPCSLKEAIEAFGPGVMPSNLPVETEEEDKVRRKVYSHLRKSRII